jgi:hypothetical protein
MLAGIEISDPEGPQKNQAVLLLFGKKSAQP